MVKPLKVFFLLLLVQGILAAFIWLVPAGRLPVHFVVPYFRDTVDFKIKFLSEDKALHPQDIKYADINTVTTKGIETTKGAEGLQPDTFHLASAKIIIHTPADSVINKLLDFQYKIEYPEKQDHLLRPFFASLDSLPRTKKLLRVFHYGDSQIEADRITSTLRRKFESIFSGSGSGILPVMEVVDVRTSWRIKQSDNWLKYAVYGGLYKKYDSRNFGPAASVFRIAKDSTHPGIKTRTAWITYSRVGKSLSRSNNFQEINFYYANITAPTQIKVYFDGKLTFSDTLGITNEFSIKTWAIDKIPGEVKIEITSEASPDVYGVSFDSQAGITFDNVPMRGSSGTEFNRLNNFYLCSELKKMNTDLIIFQFGVNVVPNVLGNYDFYENWYFKVLKNFRQQYPGASILVVGLSDMSTNDDGNYVSYPNIELIRNAQRNAAFRAGCAFWDLYAAMGGHNSMPSWVNADPPLASPDYIHFNPRGAEIIGNLLFDAIISDYYSYRKMKIGKL